MNNLLKRLRLSAGPSDNLHVSHYQKDCGDAADEIERLRAAVDALSKALSLPGGPSLAVQRHDPSWAAWKNLCDIIGHQQYGGQDGSGT